MISPHCYLEIGLQGSKRGAAKRQFERYFNSPAKKIVNRTVMLLNKANQTQYGVFFFSFGSLNLLNLLMTW